MTTDNGSSVSRSATWSVQSAEELYAVGAWGDGFYFVNDDGHAAVRPLLDTDLSIDILEVVKAAASRDVVPPLLIRFQDVLRARVRRLVEAFDTAIADAGYGSPYQAIYPVKVNQLHEVVEEVLDAGKAYNLGLECGSKTELIATLPHIGDDRLLLCNGVKDHVILSLILSAQLIGQRVLPIIEKYSEFEQLMVLADRANQLPRLAVRVKLATRGAGRWFESGGERSKFGLTISELVRLVHELERRGIQDRLELLHFHLGSQITEIHVLKQAIKEVTQVYADLHHRGVTVRCLDVGGGLGVHYGGGYGDDESAINYGLQEYANAVVFSVQEICAARDVPEPVLISESGRAITAHHSVLVVPVIGAHGHQSETIEVTGEQRDGLVQRMLAALEEARQADDNVGELLEAYHDAQEARAEADAVFRLGFLDLEQLATVETLYWGACREILDGLIAAAPEVEPPVQSELEALLTDMYLCDFSVFHSMLDHWAIDQLFPIMPLQRLLERPERRAVVVDLTCDSDGKVSQYVSSLDDRSHLPLHALKKGEPYYLGIFLVGAYQDILGDAHNLFGRLPEVHVYADDEEAGNFWIEKVIPGMSVHEMLAQVQYFPNDLNRRMSEFVRHKIDADEVRPNVGMRVLNEYQKRFNETTYCATDFPESGAPVANNGNGDER
jgi:arginine decarboxylase